MPLRGVVSGDDIDFAVRDALDRGSPDAVIEKIMAAVHDPALRGEDFTVAHAMVTVSELQLRYGRPMEAEATLRKAVADDVRDELIEARAYLAALLVGFGRSEEAAREFTRLGDLGRADGHAHLVYGESLEAAGACEEAVRVYGAGERATDDPALVAQLRKSADRARTGGAARERAEHPEAGVASVLFWPRAGHARALTTWPSLAEALGADWDEHRASVERALSRADDPTYAVADFDSFAAYTAGQQPIGTTLSGYLRVAGVSGAWPPERGAACWCGSGRKYKRCCRPRGLTG